MLELTCIVAPATPLIMEHFKSTDSMLASFVVSIYILGYAVGPLFIAPLSEMYGRVVVYHVCNSKSLDCKYFSADTKFAPFRKFRSNANILSSICHLEHGMCAVAKPGSAVGFSSTCWDCWFM